MQEATDEEWKLLAKAIRVAQKKAKGSHRRYERLLNEGRIVEYSDGTVDVVEGD